MLITLVSRPFKWPGGIKVKDYRVAKLNTLKLTRIKCIKEK